MRRRHGRRRSARRSASPDGSAKRRDHGGLIFLDLRDRTGIVQCTFDPEASREAFAIAETVRPEWVVLLHGTVRRRPDGTENPNMPTGEVEVVIHGAEVLNRSETPPFEIEAGIDTDELTRLKWRYLDIRRPEVLAALAAARPRHAALPQVARAPRLHGGRDADPDASRRRRARATSSCRAA